MSKTTCEEGMLFNVKGIPRGWLMLALTLTHLVVEWALGRPRCELKHNGEGITSLLSRLCGMKHNMRAGELAFARTTTWQARGLGWSSLQTQAPPPLHLQEWPPEGSFLQKRGWESLCFKIKPPRWPSKGKSDGGVVGFARTSPPGGHVVGTRAEVGGEVGSVLEVGFILVKR